MRQTACNKGLIALALGTLLGCTTGPDQAATTSSSTSATSASTSTSPTTAPPPAQCPQIGFTANSDDVATDITATGLDCTEASALVRRAREEHDPVNGPGSFRLPPFTCRAVRQDTALESTAYTCDDGPRRVTWSKT